MRKAFPLLRLEVQRGQDCAIACVASLTGVAYEDALVEAGRRHKYKGTYPHESGLYLSDICHIAKKLGCPLRVKRYCNFDKDEGILTVAWNHKKLAHHTVLVLKGLIFDLGEMTVWEPEDYKKANKAKFCAMLVPA